jgi:hypothetical protein
MLHGTDMAARAASSSLFDSAIGNLIAEQKLSTFYCSKVGEIVREGACKILPPRSPPLPPQRLTFLVAK